MESKKVKGYTYVLKECQDVEVSCEEREKLTNYALEMLSSTGGTRRSFFQCIFIGDVVQFWYYSPTGILYSSKISWILELERFCAILVAIMSCDYKRFGIYVPNLTPPEDLSFSIPPSSLTGFHLTMQHPNSKKGEVKVTLGNVIYVQYGIVGRSTVIYEVTTLPQISEDPLVIKITTQDVSRSPEHEIIQHVHDQGAGEYLPQIHLWTERDDRIKSSDDLWGTIPSLQKEGGGYVFEDRAQDILIMTRYERIDNKLTPQNMYYIFNQLFYGTIYYLYSGNLSLTVMVQL